MQKRIIALLSAICLLCTCFAGCGNNDGGDNSSNITQVTDVKQTDDNNFKLSYTQADSLDPFKATTQNNQVLASLVFEPLFDIDESYEISPNIATGYAFTDGKTLRVDINPQLTFSDGSQIDSDEGVL